MIGWLQCHWQPGLVKHLDVQSEEVCVGSTRKGVFLSFRADWSTTNTNEKQGTSRETAETNSVRHNGSSSEPRMSWSRQYSDEGAPALLNHQS